jgi:VIT1/CCC1 family predicted Fe2+/Mn2+ transporter
MLRTNKLSYFRNMIFGAEDSLVSTVGVLFGVASSIENRDIIILTGMVVIAVEALSMGAGSYLSESSAKEMDPKNGDSPVVDGMIMFMSYFVSGFIPLAPYVFLEQDSAKYISIVVTIIALFFLGFLPKKNLHSGLRMAFIAGMAVLFGYGISTVFNLAH